MKAFGGKFFVRVIEVGRFDFFLCVLPCVLLKHVTFVERYSGTECRSFLTFGFAILLAHFHLLIKQKKCKIGQGDGKKSK
jgi:hypothetical protein